MPSGVTMLFERGVVAIHRQPVDQAGEPWRRWCRRLVLAASHSRSGSVLAKGQGFARKEERAQVVEGRGGDGASSLLSNRAGPLPGGSTWTRTRNGRDRGGHWISGVAERIEGQA